MKYVVDIDALLECIDCIDSTRINGELYTTLPLIKEFINRFPKDKVISEYIEYNTQSQGQEQV